jgi:hypothetical protein
LPRNRAIAGAVAHGDVIDAGAAGGGHLDGSALRVSFSMPGARKSMWQAEATVFLL